MSVDREALQARLRALFIDELAENVAVLNRGLIALEQQDAAVDTDIVVNEMFRAAHSLKGGAHSAGVQELVVLCHRLEDALSRLRDGTLPSTTRVVEPLFEAVDALAGAERRMRNGGEAAGADVGRAALGLVTLVEAPPTPTETAEDPATNTNSGRSDAPIHPPGQRLVAEPSPPAARRGGNIRVPAERLEVLLNQAGELLHACGSVDGLVEELREAAGAATRRARDSAGSSDEARAWQAMAGRVDRAARGAVSASRQIGTLGRGVAESVRHARMLPLTHAYDGLERVVRDLARSGGKDVRLELRGGQVEVDRPILDAVADAVLHLARNAIDHGIELPGDRSAAGKPASGCVTVEAALVQDGVLVTVVDDGGGIDAEALGAAAERRGISVPDDASLIAEVAFVPGVSTSPLITNVSGRGVGLDAVRDRVESVGGSVGLQSTPGGGCTVTLTLPLALSAVRVLLVGAAGEVLGLPSSSVSRVLRVDATDLRSLGDRGSILLDGNPVPVLRLSDVLDLPAVSGSMSPPFAAVLAGTPPNEAVLLVDELLSEEEVVMKPLAEGPAAAPGVLGATILPSGRVALVLNPATCVRVGLAHGERSPILGPRGSSHAARRRRVLLVEDTITTRALERSILEAAGYEVLVAVDGVEAWQVLEEHGAEVVVSDVDMPRMDGVALCEAARRSSRFRDVPFILVTSLATEADRRRGVDAGANAYLVKTDFDQALLLDAIERLL